MTSAQKSNCLIIAGEKSGEDHCLSFFKELKEACPETSFWGVGGDELKKEGMELFYHLKDFSSWGISEVIGKIPFYIRAFKKIEKAVVDRNCKVAILIDFQDFNLRLARKLEKKGVKVLYYVAPQAWAWKAGRAKKLKEAVHTLFTILPFEKKWFKTRGVDQVVSVAHPLAQTMDKVQIGLKSPLKDRQISIVILPGSRKFEVQNLLPIFTKVLKKLKTHLNIKATLVWAKHLDNSIFENFKDEYDVITTNENLNKVLEGSDLSLAASGTVTLSTAVAGVPTIVAYKTSLLNEFVFYNFLSYENYISLANLIHEEEVFPEFLQNSVSVYNLHKKIMFWVNNPDEYKKVCEKIATTKEMLKGDEEDIAMFMSKVIKRADNE